MPKYDYEDTQDPRVKKLGGWYHARFSCKGERVQKSLDTQSFVIAVRIVDDIQKTILLGEDWKREGELFSDVWPQFLEDKASGKHKRKGVKKVGEKTLKEYIFLGEKWFLPFFGDERIDKLGKRWEDYIEHVRETSRAGRDARIFNHWKCMSGFYSWCVATDKVRKAPDIYNPDEDRDDDDGVGINYTDRQLKLLRDGGKIEMDGEELEVEPPMPAMRTWIYMAQFMGMRSFEITQLPKAKIDFTAGLIRLGKKQGKGGRARNVPIHPAVLGLLQEQCARHPDSPVLFPNAWDSKRPMDRSGFKKPWTELRRILGIEGRFHDFRHSYATRVFSNPDLNPVLACSALGMSMATAMKHYIHFDEKHLGRITQTFKLAGE